MKNLFTKALFTFLVVCLILGINSCGNEQPTPTIKSLLDVENLKQNLPESYLEKGTRVVFINEAGLELELEIVTSTKHIVSRSHNGQNYETESLDIRLYDPSNPSFNISIEGSILYDQQGNISERLTYWLMPLNASGHTLLSYRLDDELLRSTEFFHEQIILLNNSYSDVYFGLGKSNSGEVYTSHSELYVNSDRGVVAFKGYENQFWVLDRIIE